MESYRTPQGTSMVSVAFHKCFLEMTLEVGVEPLKYSALKHHLIELLQKDAMVNGIKSL